MQEGEVRSQYDRHNWKGYFLGALLPSLKGAILGATTFYIGSSAYESVFGTGTTNLSDWVNFSKGAVNLAQQVYSDPVGFITNSQIAYTGLTGFGLSSFVIGLVKYKIGNKTIMMQDAEQVERERNGRMDEIIEIPCASKEDAIKRASEVLRTMAITLGGTCIGACQVYGKMNHNAGKVVGGLHTFAIKTGYFFAELRDDRHTEDLYSIDVTFYEEGKSNGKKEPGKRSGQTIHITHPTERKKK
jgi:hypothetical protein